MALTQKMRQGVLYYLHGDEQKDWICSIETGREDLNGKQF